MNHVKLDKRHKGHQFFRHMIEGVRPTSVFNEIRSWCWETWGPSCEVWAMHNAKPLDEFNLKRPATAPILPWAWLHVEGSSGVTPAARFYFRGDDEYALFLLAMGDKVK